MSTKLSFLHFALELRLHIYRDYFQLDGGYVYNAKSDKLKTSDDQPIDLSLMLTCRTIANETMHMPLSLNAVTFSTLYREDWRSLAGCFNVVATYYRHLEGDLVLHLAEFMTPEMYEQYALKYPDFANQLEAVSRNHRLGWLRDNNRRANEAIAAESGSPHAQTWVETERLSGNRCCGSLGRFVDHYVNLHLDQRQHHWSDGFSRAHRERDSYSHPSNTWYGSDSVVQDALSYCLRLIADKKPVQFADHLREIFPHWTGPDIGIDGIWEYPDKWHYEGPPASPDEPFEHSSDEDDGGSGSHNDQDDEDEGGSDTDVYVPSGFHCREKIRFSATANAIRFLNRIPVNDPHTHARGLAPSVQENPSLQIIRRVSLLDCIIGISLMPSLLMRILQRGERINLEPQWIRCSLSRNIGYWIRDALVVKDVGIPAKSFTLLLQAGSHQDYCTELLQRIVHRDVAWYRLYNLRLEGGTFHHDDFSSYAIPRRMMRDEDVEAIDKLLNQTSEVLSTDFNTGNSLDAQALASQTKDLDGFDWYRKWQLLDGSLWQEIPPVLKYDRLADIIELRTDNGQLVANPQSTQRLNRDF
ncbi:uncharacterized protein FTJAE_11323 [Fusarium tjaetaba]|uniref:Uncharacterized protein n=1 Tax=Fusarium tjaetaba TaxID=1567544 RepID=A0A8H5QVJ1_9HYPO|nr:uncharacterized protein FTJAE_11323 [Fusarium tjaetaba]KAF5621352.1 hypothetical protein FTJAE_11323 [Fusarium tjaetaba]